MPVPVVTTIPYATGKLRVKTPTVFGIVAIALADVAVAVVDAS